VPVVFEGNEIVMRVDAAVASGPYPAVLDPTLTPEQGIDQPTSEATGDVSNVALVAGPAQTYLAAWIERNYASASIVRAVRLGADGTPIGSPATLATDVTDSVSVAWDGTRWLVAAAGATNTAFVRVAADGTVVDAVPKTIPGKSTSVAAAYDGTKFLLAWDDSDFAAAGSLRAVRVDPAAATFDIASAVTIAGPTVMQSSPRRFFLACGSTSTGCAAGWRGTGNLRVSRLSSAGALLDANGIDLGVANDPRGIASDGNQWLVGWRAGTATKSARIAADGTVTTSSDLGTGSGHELVSLTFDGTNFVAVLRVAASSYYLYGRRVTTTGVVVDTSAVLLDGPTTYTPAAAFAASGTSRLLLTARSDFTNDLAPAYARPYSASLVATGPAVVVTKGSNTQRGPVAGFNGSNFLVLWRDNRTTTGPGVYAARLDTNGTPIDTVGTKIDFIGELASDGDGFLAVTTNASSELVAKRFSKSSATPIDASPIVIATDVQSYTSFSLPRVAFDGTNYIVVWSSRKTSDLTGADIRAARVSPSGAVLDPEGFIVSTASGPQWEPGVAGDGKGGSFVAWVDRRTDYYEGDIHGARITSAGTLLDPQSILIARRPRSQWAPRVAPAGDGWTVIWGDDALDTAEPFATHVSAGGVADPKPFALGGPNAWQSPQIVSMNDGATQFAAWLSDKQAGVEGVFVRSAPSVELLDSQPIAVSPVPGPIESFSLVPAGTGRAAVFYSRFVEADRSYRVRLRFVSSGAAAGTACTAESECRGRWCRESVCCSEKCDGACRKCAATTGACEIVRSADDPDTCSGENTCDADGSCKKRNGSVCEQASECASGNCVGSFCCDTACSGSCETCADTRGTCTPRPRGSLGVPSCSPNRCDGTSRTCAGACQVDSDCADGFGCDRPTGTCISGAVCIDIATLRDNGSEISCPPYACRGGKCLQSCKDVTECAYPSVCGESGRCVAPPDGSGGGCALAAAPARRAPISPATWIAVAALALLCVRSRRRA
jgi:hypothetical protein